MMAHSSAPLFFFSLATLFLWVRLPLGRVLCLSLGPQHWGNFFLWRIPPLLARLALLLPPSWFHVASSSGRPIPAVRFPT